jgi:hypothetical protein
MGSRNRLASAGPRGSPGTQPHRGTARRSRDTWPGSRCRRPVGARRLSIVPLPLHLVPGGAKPVPRLGNFPNALFTRTALASSTRRRAAESKRLPSPIAVVEAGMSGTARRGRPAASARWWSRSIQKSQLVSIVSARETMLTNQSRCTDSSSRSPTRWRVLRELTSLYLKAWGFETTLGEMKAHKRTSSRAALQAARRRGP